MQLVIHYSSILPYLTFKRSLKQLSPLSSWMGMDITPSICSWVAGKGKFLSSNTSNSFWEQLMSRKVHEWIITNDEMVININFFEGIRSLFSQNLRNSAMGMRREGLWKANLLLQLTWKQSSLVVKSNATMWVSPVLWEAARTFTIHSASISPYFSEMRSLKQLLSSSWMDMKTTLSNCLCLSLQGKFLSSYTRNSLKEYSTSLKELLLAFPTPKQMEQVRRVQLRCCREVSRVQENWRTSRTAQLQGLPYLVSFCFTGFCLRTFSLMPEYSLKPVMDPTMPVKPMLTKGWEPFSFRLQTTRMGNLFIGLRTSQSSARSCTRCPPAVAFPHAPRMEHPARVYSGIILISITLWKARPDPALMPAYQSRKRLGVKGRVMQWFHMRRLFMSLTPRVLPSGCSFSGSLAMNLNSSSARVQQYFHRLSQFWLSYSRISYPQANPAWQEDPQTRMREKYWSWSVERQMYFQPNW